jgi:hypothetical protein
MKPEKLQQVILLLLTLIVGIYIVASVEFYDETVDMGESKEVRQQPYLASKLLLNRMGVATTIEDDYRRLFSDTPDAVIPQLDEAIILVDANAAISQRLGDELLSWVESGGYLITAVNAEAFQDSFRANALLEKLGVGVHWLVDDPLALSKFEQKESILNDPNSHKIEVGLESAYRITLPEDSDIFYAVDNEDGYTLIQLEYGEGLITFVTETYIWNNQQLAQHDNAILLVSFLDNMSHVYVFSPKEQAHWFILLYQYAAEFVGLLALLIAISLWHLASRFGPTMSLFETTQSYFTQHIKVAGDHYWEQGNQHILLAEVRNHVLLLVGKKWPGAKGAEAQKVILLLQELSGWSPETINKLMFADNTLNQSQFTQCMKGLQQLRKML